MMLGDRAVAALGEGSRAAWEWRHIFGGGNTGGGGFLLYFMRGFVFYFVAAVLFCS
jgi:hypothetical protein